MRGAYLAAAPGAAEVPVTENFHDFMEEAVHPYDIAIVSQYMFLFDALDLRPDGVIRAPSRAAAVSDLAACFSSMILACRLVTGSARIGPGLLRPVR
jgi:hypothetical protein